MIRHAHPSRWRTIRGAALLFASFVLGITCERVTDDESTPAPPAELARIRGTCSGAALRVRLAADWIESPERRTAALDAIATAAADVGALCGAGDVADVALAATITPSTPEELAAARGAAIALAYALERSAGRRRRNDERHREGSWQ